MQASLDWLLIDLYVGQCIASIIVCICSCIHMHGSAQLDTYVHSCAYTSCNCNHSTWYSSASGSSLVFVMQPHTGRSLMQPWLDSRWARKVQVAAAVIVRQTVCPCASSCLPHEVANAGLVMTHLEQGADTLCMHMCNALPDCSNCIAWSIAGAIAS